MEDRADGWLVNGTLRLESDDYRPGACNIGPAEIAVRRRSGLASLVVAFVLAAILVAIDAPAAARWLVAVPVGGAAAGLLQARLRFCAAYGFQGLMGFRGRGHPDPVADPADRVADRRKALGIAFASAAIGLAAGAALVALPL